MTKTFKDTDKSEKIRPIYTELQGYLREAPNPKDNSDVMYYDVDGSLMDQLGKSVRELQDVTGNDYSRYNVSPHIIGGLARTNPNVQEYRSNLGGLISRLYGEFFSDEVNPLSGSPSLSLIHISEPTRPY